MKEHSNATVLKAVAMVIVGLLATQISAPMMKSLFPVIGVYGALLGRAGMGFLVFQALRPRTWRTFQRDKLPLYLLYGLLLGSKGVFMFNAMRFQSIGVVMTIDFLGPLGLAIYMALRKRDYSTLPAGFLALAGLTMVTGLISERAHHDGAAIVGVVLAINSAVCSGLFIPINRQVNRAHPDQGGNVIGGLFSLLVITLTGVIMTRAGTLPGLDLHSITWPVLGVMFLTGMIGNTTPVLLQSIALSTLSADIMACLRALLPVFSMIVGSVVLHEHVSALQVMGMLMIIAASLQLSLNAMPGFQPRDLVRRLGQGRSRFQTGGD